MEVRNRAPPINLPAVTKYTTYKYHPSELRKQPSIAIMCSCKQRRRITCCATGFFNKCWISGPFAAISNPPTNKLKALFCHPLHPYLNFINMNLKRGLHGSQFGVDMCELNSPYLREREWNSEEHECTTKNAEVSAVLMMPHMP